MVHKNILLSFWRFYDALLSLTSLLLLNLNGQLRQTVLRPFFHHWLRWQVLRMLFIEPSELSGQTWWPCQLQLPSCPLLWWHPQEPSVSCCEQQNGSEEGTEALNTRALGRNPINDGSINRFQEFGAIFSFVLTLFFWCLHSIPF